MEIFTDMAGISLHHVPYKGTAPALNDVMAGQVAVCFDAIAPALGYIRGGRIRALAVVGSHRVASLPDVPTFAESGFPKYTFASWFGIYAPARTPRDIVEKLNRELVRILRMPETQERFARLGIDTEGTSAAALAAHLSSEIAQYSRIVRARGIRAE
jgi:tripartite-type tricarboxylate transporter receptor subunit TctC